MGTEEAEIVLTASFLRSSLSVCAVRDQARLLLGRLEMIGPGGAAAALRRNSALQAGKKMGEPEDFAREVNPEKGPLQS